MPAAGDLVFRHRRDHKVDAAAAAFLNELLDAVGVGFVVGEQVPELLEAVDEDDDRRLRRFAGLAAGAIVFDEAVS